MFLIRYIYPSSIFKTILIFYKIPPDTEDEADWVVRLDGLCAAGWMDGGVDGCSTNSAEL